MIVAERKPMEEILRMIAGRGRVLLVGCGMCMKVCSAGGEAEVALLASQLRMAARKEGRDIVVTEATVERQCETEFVTELTRQAEDHDLVMSMACGAGVQMLVEKFLGIPVAPAVNTTHLGIFKSEGVFEEKCLGCGDCVLDRFGGICPVTQCSKSMLNGPCGGSKDGRCEVDPDKECGWSRIIERMTALGELHKLAAIEPPKNWRPARHGGTRKTVIEEHILA